MTTYSFVNSPNINKRYNRYFILIIFHICILRALFVSSNFSQKHEHRPSIDNVKSSLTIHTLSRLLRIGIAWLNVRLTSRLRNSQVYLYFPSSNNVSNNSPCNFQAPVGSSRVRFPALEPKFTVGFNISALPSLHRILVRFPCVLD